MVWAAENAISLRDLARLLRERTGLILVLGLGAAALGFGLGTILPRSFQAEGLLVVDPHEINIPDFQTIRSQGTVEPWGARSAARALVSRELVDRVARQLDVGSNPAFNPALRSNLAETLLRATGLSALYRRERLDNAAAWEDLVEAIRRNLTVASEERSYAIGVAFTWRDAIAAADIVNAVMGLYVEQELEAKRRAMAEASKQLRRQGEELYADLKATWARIRQLENSGSMVTTVTGTVISQRLTTLAGEEQNVENESARARADLEQISAAQRSGRANLLNPELVTPRLQSTSRGRGIFAWEDGRDDRQLRAEAPSDAGASSRAGPCRERHWRRNGRSPQQPAAAARDAGAAEGVAESRGGRHGRAGGLDRKRACAARAAPRGGAE